MLEESNEAHSVVLNPVSSEAFSSKVAFSSLPRYGEVIARITDARKVATNYENYITYQIYTVVSAQMNIERSLEIIINSPCFFLGQSERLPFRRPCSRSAI